LDVFLLRLRKDILEISQRRGGILSRERSLSTTKEEASMPTIENGRITKGSERRSLNEGETFEDQTAEKADDVIKARCFFSFLRVVVVVLYTD